MAGRIPRWVALPLWGLGISVLLHWVALDLLRLPGLSLADGRQRPLQVTIEEAQEVKREVRQEGGNMMPIASPSSTPAKPDAPDARKAEPSLEMRRPESPAPVAEVAPLLAVGLQGVRSGSLDEALTAVRLALAMRMRGNSAWTAMTGVRNWSISIDAAGNVVGVSGDDLPAGLREDLVSLLGALPLPDVLRGRAFELALSVE